MRATLELLRGLQDLDRDLYQVKDELRRLPRELARRQERIDNEKSRVAELERKLHETKTRIKEIEDMTTASRQRLRKLENEIGGTADQALIVAYQHEIRSLRREISEAEGEGLGLVDEADGLEAQRDEQQAVVDGMERDHAEYAENVAREIREAEARRAELEEERGRRMSGPVERQVLVEYEKLLEAREGQAMALLDGRVCQGCYVSVPSNLYVRLARGREMVNCPSCGRILYLPEL